MLTTAAIWALYWYILSGFKLAESRARRRR